MVWQVLSDSAADRELNTEGWATIHGRLGERLNVIIVGGATCISSPSSLTCRYSLVSVPSAFPLHGSIPIPPGGKGSGE